MRCSTSTGCFQPRLLRRALRRRYPVQGQGLLLALAQDPPFLERAIGHCHEFLNFCIGGHDRLLHNQKPCPKPRPPS
jgi:hypothetical protein